MENGACSMKREKHGVWEGDGDGDGDGESFLDEGVHVQYRFHPVDKNSRIIKSTTTSLP